LQKIEFGGIMNVIRCFVTGILSFFLLYGLCSSSLSYTHLVENKRDTVIYQVSRHKAYDVLYCITAQWEVASEIIDTMDNSTVMAFLEMGELLDEFFRSVNPYEMDKAFDVKTAQEDDKLIAWPLSMSEAVGIAKDFGNIKVYRTRNIGASLISFYADILKKHIEGVSVPDDDKRLALAIENRFINANFSSLPKDWTGILYQVRTEDDTTIIIIPASIRPITNPIDDNQTGSTKENH